MIHLLREPTALALSNYLYHTESPPPLGEEWVEASLPRRARSAPPANVTAAGRVRAQGHRNPCRASLAEGTVPRLAGALSLSLDRPCVLRRLATNASRDP